MYFRLNLTVINNTAPSFTSISNASCAEEALCQRNFIAYDVEGSNLSFYATASFTTLRNATYNYTNETTISSFNITFSSFNGIKTKGLQV